ncbi:helix-turn-helix domain-containing protein [Sphingomonas bacterium]|uniref:AraC family transcriptional regulator n=1 Tax=Sphingomonas bacterium TaxID=1895847 RepID=UPI0026136073|nr:helix-turn-helix domain-containing protein [Sphingomonas bacterium]MDB5679720.1 Transcriptional regulator, AraC family [Sphingomonas bacterium]
MQMPLLDTVMRMLAIGQLLLIVLVIGRGRAPRAIRWTTAALLLGVSAYLMLATPVFRPIRGPFWAVIQLAAQAVPLLLWVFAHLLFERPVDRRIAVAAILVLLACWSCFYLLALWGPGALIWNALVQRLTSLLLIGHAILIALRERGDDLIEKRRRLRVGFVVVVGGLAFVVIVLELILGFHRGSEIALGQAFAILVATTAMGAALLQSDPELLFDPAQTAPPTSFSASEHVLNGKLDAALADAVYREPGLTIGVLAGQLGTPEHRLRSLINQRLGYRNFSAFLNHYRVAEAKALLADPRHVDLPILTIAMDLGYGSLAPFNRAFREETGQAPSEFRRAAILPS